MDLPLLLQLILSIAEKLSSLKQHKHDIITCKFPLFCLSVCIFILFALKNTLFGVRRFSLRVPLKIEV